MGLSYASIIRDAQQVRLNIDEEQTKHTAPFERFSEAFGRAGGTLDDAERERWRRTQPLAYREAFVLAGIDHPRFRKTVERSFADGQAEITRASERGAMPSVILSRSEKRSSS